MAVSAFQSIYAHEQEHRQMLLTGANDGMARIYKSMLDFENDGSTFKLPDGPYWIAGSLYYLSVGVLTQYSSDAVALAALDSRVDVLEASPKTFVHVKYFGAVGDWNYTTKTGTDDTAAFQAAINYALTNKISEVVFDKAHKITSLNITNKYTPGLIFRSTSNARSIATDSFKHASIIVSGADSVGFDISGTEGIILRNCVIWGDESNKPKTAIFGQRTTAAQFCSGHKFIDFFVGGSFQYAGIYSFGMEVITLERAFGKINAGRWIYHTSLNSVGVVSPFLTAPQRVAVTPMGTKWAWNNCDWHSYDETGLPCIDIEGALNNASGVNPVTGATGGTPYGFAAGTDMRNFQFINCYSFVAGKLAKPGSSIKFTDVAGAVLVVNQREEAGSQANGAYPYPCDAFIEIVTTAGTATELTNLDIIGGELYGSIYAVKGGRVKNYRQRGLNCFKKAGGGSNLAFSFDYARNVDFDRISGTQTFTALDGNNFNIILEDQSYSSSVTLPSRVINLGEDKKTTGTPSRNVNPPRIGHIVRDNNCLRTYIAVSTDAYGDTDTQPYQPLVTRVVSAQVPVTNTPNADTTYGATSCYGQNFKVGDIVYANAPAAGGYIGWIVTALAGGSGSVPEAEKYATCGTITSVTWGTFTVGSPIFPITSNNGLSKFRLGQVLGVPGWWGGKIILLANDSLTLSTNYQAGSGATLSFINPTFKEYGAIVP